MATTTRIDQFDVMYSSNKFCPRIGLISAGKFVATLCFYPNDQTLPSDTTKNNQFMLFYHLDDFQNVIDLLETEKNLYLLWNGPAGENTIQTSQEQVGAGIEVKAA